MAKCSPRKIRLSTVTHCFTQISNAGSRAYKPVRTRTREMKVVTLLDSEVSTAVNERKTHKVIVPF